MRLFSVSSVCFLRSLATAQREHHRVADATTPVDEFSLAQGDVYYLSSDLQSGFVVRADGELVGVFSTVKGRGEWLLSEAIAAGATNLDCFDGYLTDFYGAHGFRVVKRERNWDPTGPDVVWMRRTA
jgi:hypothetical protein